MDNTHINYTCRTCTCTCMHIYMYMDMDMDQHAAADQYCVLDLIVMSQHSCTDSYVIASYSSKLSLSMHGQSLKEKTLLHHAQASYH